MELQIERRHRFRNLTEYGSFGPGVYANYDTKVFLNEVDGGFQIDVFDPREMYTIRLVDGINGDTLDGQFVDQRNNSVREARLLDASDVLTTDLNLAKTIEVEAYSGQVHRFGVIDLAGDTVSDNGLKGHWQFNEVTGSTALDSSTEGNDGTIIQALRVASSGAPIPGGAGGALLFDGINDYVDLPSTDDLSITDTITLMAWIKTDKTTGIMNVVSQGDQTGPEGEIYLRVNNNNGATGQYQIGFWDGAANNASFTIPAEDKANGGQWVHLAGVYDGQQLRLYRNGLLVAASQKLDLPDLIEDWTIGARNKGADRFFTGEIDDVRIYNRNVLEGDIVQLAQQRVLAGRLTQIEDRNGYSTDLTYKSFTQAEIDLSPERQWQIDTVTDPYSRTATFNYKTDAQVAGQWVVERIDLPNGSDVDYLYEDGLHLTKAIHEDGTESTFSYSSNTTSQTTTVTFDDAAAEGTHRRKTVYLTNSLVSLFNQTMGEIYNQSALLVRMVVNGADEVAYLNMGDPNSDGGNGNVIYEGAGKLRYLQGARYRRHYKDGWTMGDPANGFGAIQGNLESSFIRVPAALWSNSFISKGTYPKYIDDQGRTFEMTYDGDSHLTSKTYDDASSEAWAYNGFKQVTLYTDRLGRQVRNTYDTNGNVLTNELGIINGANQPAPEYAVYTNTYYNGAEGSAFAGITGAATVQPVGLRKSSEDANGNVTHYVYNDDNFLIAMIAPADNLGDDRAVTEYTYDTSGRMLTSTDPLDRVTTYAYDVRDRQKSTTYHDGSTEVYFYGNELPGGAGTQANLVVAVKDRNDNYTQLRYDGHGRMAMSIGGITTEADALNQALIEDPSYHDVMVCSYLPGTNLKTACVVNGERRETAYDHRHRPVEMSVHTREAGTFPYATGGDLVDIDGDGSTSDDDGQLDSRMLFQDNMPFAAVDPYGRATYFVYRASDRALIRIVKEAARGGSGLNPNTATSANVAALTRDLSYEDASSLGVSDIGGAPYIIVDYILDSAGQVTSIIDPRNVQHDIAYDSRGRSTSQIQAFGTLIAATTEMDYDAQSNVTQLRSPRYFDSSDTEGFEKSFITMAYNGRNLLKSRTVGAGDTTYDDFVTNTTGNGSKATEAFSYYLDGRMAKRTDFNGNDPQYVAAEHEWLTIWRECCKRLRAQVDPAGNGRAVGTDFAGNTTHRAAIEDLLSEVQTNANGSRFITDSDDGGPGIWDVPDTKTLAETTTRFDSKHRPVAHTTWLEPLGKVDPNDAPILYGSTIQGGANAQTAAKQGAAQALGAGDGLTTLYYYTEDLHEVVVISAGVEGAPNRGSNPTHVLVHQFSGAPTINLQPLLNELTSDGIEVLDLDNTNASAFASINPEGEISAAIMDGAGRVVASAWLDPTTNAPVSWSTTNHDRVVNVSGFGDVLEAISISGLDNVSRGRVDGMGRVVQTIDAEDNAAFAVYDNNGNIIRNRDANDVGADRDYDARSRRTASADTQGDTRSWAYNRVSQVLTSTDGKSVTSAAPSVYDARGRLLESTTRISTLDKNARAYDPNSNLLSVTDAESGTTTYEYDPRNLRTATNFPGHDPADTPGDLLGDYDRYEYMHDGLRRLLVKTDPQGDTATYLYDLASRTEQRDYRLKANSTPGSNGLPSGTISDSDIMTFDDASRLLTAVSGRYSNTAARTYDTIGRRATEALTISGQTYTVGYTDFDDDSRLTTLTYPDGSQVKRTYTDRNQRDETRYDADGTGGGASVLIADCGYDAGLRETSRALGNGLDTTFTYRDDNLLESIEVETSPGAGNKQALHFDYTYDANKNVLSETRAAGNTSNRAYRHSYSLTQDGKDRMTGWTRINTLTDLDAQTWNLSFEHDWTSTTTTDASTDTIESRTFNPVHEILEIDPDDDPGTTNELTQTHDAKGNLSNDGQGRAFVHDFDNQLSQVTVSPGASRGTPGTHSYAYDAVGRRVSKTTNSVTTVFIQTGAQVLAEYTSGAVSTAPLCKYIYGVYIDEPIALIDRTSAGAVAAGTDELLYVHRNRQYSVSGLTDSTGAVVERYSYTAYGEPTIYDGTGLNERTTSLYGNAYLHTGRRFDAESALYYYRARYYDALLGRFLERDPLGYPDGLNTYAAYHVMWGGLDPWGMRTEEEEMAGRRGWSNNQERIQQQENARLAHEDRDPSAKEQQKQKEERWAADAEKRKQGADPVSKYVGSAAETLVIGALSAPDALVDSVCFTAERGYVASRAFGEGIQFRLGLTDDLYWNDRNDANVEENHEVANNAVDGVVHMVDMIATGTAEERGEATAGFWLIIATRKPGKCPNSPKITPDDLAGKTRSEIRQMADEKGLKPAGDSSSPDYPRKWKDPVTNKERVRLDRGHVDPKTGMPYNNPKAANDHVHGYEADGKTKIVVQNDPHVPTTGE